MSIYVQYDSEGCYFTVDVFLDGEDTTLQYDDKTMSWKETKHPLAGCTVTYPAKQNSTVLGEKAYQWNGNDWETLPLDEIDNVSPNHLNELEDAYERAMKGI